MTKDELKRLSEEIFFDNQHEAITPEQHRIFNSRLIESMVSTTDMRYDGDSSKYLSDDGGYKSFEELNCDILPAANNAHSLGNSRQVWKNVSTWEIGAKDEESNILLTSGLIPSGNNVLNLGDEAAKFFNMYVHRINGSNFSNTGWTICEIAENTNATSLYWSVSGNSLFLAGEYTHTSGSTTSIHIINIPEMYVKRVLTGTCFLDMKDKQQNTIRVTGNITVNNSQLVLTSAEIEYPFSPDHTFVFFSFMFPLPEDENEVVRQITGIEYGDWNYDNLPQTVTRTRTLTPWTQDVYVNAQLGEKVFGQSHTESEDAYEVIISEGEWIYSIAEDKLSATRKKEYIYTYLYHDIAKEITDVIIEENTELETNGKGEAVYEISADRRKCARNNTKTVHYVFSDYKLPGEEEITKTIERNLSVINTSDKGRVYGYDFGDEMYVPDDGKEKYIDYTIDRTYEFIRIVHDGDYFIALRFNDRFLYYSKDGIEWKTMSFGGVIQYNIGVMHGDIYSLVHCMFAGYL